MEKKRTHVTSPVKDYSLYSSTNCKLYLEKKFSRNQNAWYWSHGLKTNTCC